MVASMSGQKSQAQTEVRFAIQNDSDSNEAEVCFLSNDPETQHTIPPRTTEGFQTVGYSVNTVDLPKAHIIQIDLGDSPTTDERYAILK